MENNSIKETGLLMSKPMAIATISGKTKTRRLTGLDSINEFPKAWKFSNMELNPREFFGDPDHEEPKEKTLKGNFAVFYDNEKASFIKCPYGKPGDRIFVRENFRLVSGSNITLEFTNRDKWEYTIKTPEMANWFVKQSEKLLKKGVLVPDETAKPGMFNKFTDKPNPWTPSIHLPKWGSRLWLEIADVNIERLNKISDADCISEGIEHMGNPHGVSAWKDYSGAYENLSSPQHSFRSLWASIHGDTSWNENPWVWVITFKVIPNPHTP